MKRIFLLALVLLTFPASTHAQTGGANQLAHGTLAQRPATCKVSRGEVYYQTDSAGDGAGSYECGPSDNQWRRMGAQTLDQLTDVSVSSPASGHALVFNGSLFVNRALVKGDVGLGNVDNTSDASKPVSTAQQAALDLKASISALTSETSARTSADTTLQANIDAEASARASAITSASTADRARSNHTGTQSADTLTDGTTNKAFTATERTKLSGIATGATANSSDATLLARANHTGTQAIGTVNGLQTALDAKQDALGFTPESSANKSTDLAADALSNIKYSTPKSIKDYFDAHAVTNSAGSNVIPKSNGTNLVPSRAVDDMTAEGGEFRIDTLGTGGFATGDIGGLSTFFQIHLMPDAVDIGDGEGPANVTMTLNAANQTAYLLGENQVQLGDFSRGIGITIDKPAGTVGLTATHVTVPTPTGSTDAATKNYVDTGLATKAASSHNHAASDINSGTIAAARMPALTGDVTTSAGAVATTIANDAVSNAKLANVATQTFKGRVTAGTGDPEDLTASQVKTALAISTGDVSGLGTLATQNGTFSGTSSGTNTGDQTSIVGISGTTAQFNTALSDNDFATLAGAESLSNKKLNSLTTNGPIYTSGGDGTLNSEAQLSSSRGGTGSAFFSISGPTATRTYTFPDANATIARTDAAQTFTGNQTFAGDILGSGDGTRVIGAAAANRFGAYLYGLNLGNTGAISAGAAKFFSGTSGIQLQSGFLQLGSAVGVGWSSGDVFAAGEDTRIKRAKAAVVDFTNASTGGGTLRAVATSPAQITADQNNYTLSSGAPSMFIRLTSDASRSITGLSISQVDGEIHTIFNVGSNNIVLVHESASSTAANRFTNSTAADITLSAGQAADLVYDNTSARWRVFKRN